jgi:hypothetical protein
MKEHEAILAEFKAHAADLRAEIAAHRAMMHGFGLGLAAAAGGGAAGQWNPTSEPALSVKRVLIEIGARVDVLPERTIGDLGLDRHQVQVAMNTEFFEGTQKRLSTEQCGESVMVITLVGTIADLQDA